VTRTEDPHILIHPRRGKKEKSLPKTGILFVNPSEARSAHTLYRKVNGESRFLFNSELSVAEDGIGFVAGPSIGAPMAVMTMEKLIVLGAQRIILFGWCGTISSKLDIGDILIPDSALSGEGTSCYYGENSTLKPSLLLNQKLEYLFDRREIRYKNGRVWSTDAIYREDRRLLKKLKFEENILAVDMEFSALCSVAMFRGIQFSALLMVSDELWGEKWKAGFSSTKFKTKCKHIRSLLLDHIKEI